MGERCFIRAHNEPEPIGGSSKTHYAVGMAFEVDCQGIPLLWVALFTKDNLKSVTVPENFLDGNAPEVTIPTLHSSKSTAVETFERRIPFLRDHIDPAIWPFVELFQNAVRECKYSHIELDLHALWGIQGESADKLKEIILCHMQAFESAASWCALYGDKLIGDTSELYGLPFFGIPFEGEIELPWCHATTEGGVEPSEPRDDIMSIGGRRVHIDRDSKAMPELTIDQYFVLTYDTEPDVAVRFAHVFKDTWAKISVDVRDYLFDHWKDTAIVTLPGNPRQMVYTPERPYLGLLKIIPKENSLSLDCGGGRALLWSAPVLAFMDDTVLSAFIGENIACAYGHARKINMEDADYSAFVQKIAKVSLSFLLSWMKDEQVKIEEILDRYSPPKL